MSKDREQKVLILYGDSGYGGYNTALAIKESIEKESASDIKVYIVNPIKKSDKLTSLLLRIHNRICAQKPEMYNKLILPITEFCQVHKQDILQRRLKKFMMKVISEIQPSIIISTYPLLNHIPIEVLKDVGKREEIQFVTFVADGSNGLMKAWINSEVDGFLVSSTESREQLLRASIPPEKIRMVQFPIRQSLKQDITINNNKILIIYCARKGSGYLASNLKKIYSDNHIQLVFLCGDNKGLIKKLKKKYPKSIIEGYCSEEKMGYWLSQGSYIYGQFGAVLYFECIHKGVIPLICTNRGIIKHEEGICESLITKKIGYRIRSNYNLEKALDRLKDETVYNKYRHRIYYEKEQHTALDEIGEMIKRKLGVEDYVQR